MAIAFDAVSTGQGNLGAASSQTISHTVASGSNRVLVVCCTTYNTTDANRNITGITYAGVALTQVLELSVDAKDGTSEIWRLVNPATGANNCVISYAGTSNVVGNAVLSYTGVYQVNPIDLSNSAQGNGLEATVNITTNAPGDWVIDSAAQFGNRVMTVGAGQTERANLNAGAALQTGVSDEGPKTPAGSVTMNWTWTGVSNNWITTTVALIEPVLGGITPKFTWKNQKPPRGIQVNKTHSLAKGLIGGWLLQERAGNFANDSSGTGLKGTLTSNPAWVTGRFGSALSFNNSYVKGTGLNLVNKPLTISAWIYSNTWTANKIWFSLGNVGTNNNAIHLRQTSDTGLLFGMWNDDLSVTVPNIANVWSHIVVTLDITKAQKIYLNRILMGTRTATNLFSGNDVWAIGEWVVSDSEQWNGLIDHIMVYDRDLSQVEVNQLYSEPFLMFLSPAQRRWLWDTIVPVSTETITIDKWYPGMNKPFLEKNMIVGY